MSKYLIVPVAIACGLLLWFWGSGGFDNLAAWAAGEQREFQNQIARALAGSTRRAASGCGNATDRLFRLRVLSCHRPGHGKVLIGGYGLGRRVAFWRLSAISVLSSLGQAVTAVVLVYAGVLVFQMSRETLGRHDRTGYGADQLRGNCRDWPVAGFRAMYAVLRDGPVTMPSLLKPCHITTTMTMTTTTIITTTRARSARIAATATAPARKKSPMSAACARRSS